MLYRNFRPLESPLYHINFTSRVKNSRIADSHSSTRNYEYQEYHKTVEDVGRKRLLSEYRRGNLSLHESFCILRFEENAFSVSSGLASVFEILAVKLTPITYTGRERPWHFQLWIFCCLTYFFYLLSVLVLVIPSFLYWFPMVFRCSFYLQFLMSVKFS